MQSYVYNTTQESGDTTTAATSACKVNAYLLVWQISERQIGASHKISTPSSMHESLVCAFACGSLLSEKAASPLSSLWMQQFMLKAKLPAKRSHDHGNASHRWKTVVTGFLTCYSYRYNTACILTCAAHRPRNLSSNDKSQLCFPNNLSAISRSISLVICLNEPTCILSEAQVVSSIPEDIMIQMTTSPDTETPCSLELNKIMFWWKYIYKYGYLKTIVRKACKETKRSRKPVQAPLSCEWCGHCEER